jgi:hypothetical protein
VSLLPDGLGSQMIKPHGLTYIVNRFLINPEMKRLFAISRCIFAVFNSEGALSVAKYSGPLRDQN